jgi:hypothetical protein
VAGRLAPPPAAAASSPAAPAVDQVAAGNQNQANQNQAAQNAPVQQGYVINQQTGPSANLNVAPPPAKADEQRRQAERSKGERGENEKAAGGPSNVKSSDVAGAKAAEEPKALARAKAAPQEAGQDKAAAAAPKEAAPAAGADAPGKSGNARSSGGASPTFRAAADATRSESGATGGAGGAAAATTPAGARPVDTNTGGLNESVTITSAPPASPVMRSADGARWWRIRAPSTIEGSSDRGATWTVEYSEPSARLVRGAAAAKGGCWMIGANGLVLRTRPNGGWERVTQPTTRALVTVTARDHLIAAVTDDQGRSYRTTDGGASWR